MAWIPCSGCETFWCSEHGTHAHDCPCPPIEEWERDPYEEDEEMAKRIQAERRSKPIVRGTGDGPGRPPGPDGTGRTIRFYCPPAISDAVRKKAKREGLSFSRACVEAMKAWLDD